MIITQIDDGRGRFLFDPDRNPPVKMNVKEDFHQVSEPGDYAFEVVFDTVETLVAVCPFCGIGAPLPFLIKVTSKNPLNIEDELVCGRCHVRFHVIKGFAYKSWIPLEALERCLNGLTRDL